jgi:hypothetical protein
MKNKPIVINHEINIIEEEIYNADFYSPEFEGIKNEATNEDSL